MKNDAFRRRLYELLDSEIPCVGVIKSPANTRRMDDSLLALNEELHGVMDAMADNVSSVSECQMTADTNFTDTSTKRYRYQCLYNIFY